MSRTGVIVALVITIALAAVALVVLRSPPQPSAHAGPLLKFEPAALAEIAVTPRPGETQRARRISSAQWVIELPGQPPWPASPERIRAAIRILSTLEAVRPADRHDTPITGMAELRLTLDGGRDHTMLIEPRAIGGAVLVSTAIDDQRRTAWADSAIADMLITTGLAPWRDTSAMGAIGAEVSRARVEGTHGTLELARVRGRWGLTAPIAEIAEPDAVARLFSLVAQTRVLDFLDAGPPGATGLDAPVATLTLEHEQRSPDDPAAVTTHTRTLHVGRTADVAGKTVFARLSGQSISAAGAAEPWSRTVILDGKPLADISTDAATYIARRATQAAAADVGEILISAPGAPPRPFRRTLDGWTRVEDGRAIPVGPDDLAGIRALLDILTQRSADSVSLRTPDNAVELASVQLHTLGGDPIADFAFAGAKAAPVAIRAGQVWRLYSAPGADRLHQWLIPR
jgi:hypothetical protein